MHIMQQKLVISVINFFSVVSSVCKSNGTVSLEMLKRIQIHTLKIRNGCAYQTIPCLQITICMVAINFDQNEVLCAQKYSSSKRRSKKNNNNKIKHKNQQQNKTASHTNWELKRKNKILNKSR